MSADRIVSLVPGATETLFRLGLGPRVEAVSHACDHPEEAKPLPKATRTRVDADQEDHAIDEQVRASREEDQPLFEVLEQVLHHAQPGLVIAQDACSVCGITPVDVEAALARIEPVERPEILALHPHTFEDVLQDLQRIADAAGAPQRGERLVGELRGRVQHVRRDLPDATPRALVLDWLDPPMAAGHWVPDMLEAAGAKPLLVTNEAPSMYVDLDQIREASPEHLVLAPCGFDAERAQREARDAGLIEALGDTRAVREGNVHALNANAYTSRPGPRLVDGIEQLAHALYPGADVATDQAEHVLTPPGP